MTPAPEEPEPDSDAGSPARQAPVPGPRARPDASSHAGPDPKPGHQPRLQFWYDFASHYSWIAARRVEGAARAAGVALTWRPFLLGPIFAANGWNDSPFNVYPAKGAYAWRDVARLANGLGLALTRPQPFPQNSLQAARVALSLPDVVLPDFTTALFAAEFEQGRGLSEGAIRQALAHARVDADATLAAAVTPGTKQALRVQTEAAIAAGIFGAPAFVASDGELFWGNDRLEQALAWEVALGAS